MVRLVTRSMGFRCQAVGTKPEQLAELSAKYLNEIARQTARSNSSNPSELIDFTDTSHVPDAQ